MRNTCRLVKCFVFQQDSRSTINVLRNGSFEISPMKKLHNNHLYAGNDNYVSISRNYTTEYECKFSMHYYPFDIQQCNMKFITGVCNQ